MCAVVTSFVLRLDHVNHADNLDYLVYLDGQHKSRQAEKMDNTDNLDCLVYSEIDRQSKR